MRKTSTLVLSAAVLGGGLLLAAPASAQTATTPCPYPFDDCPTASPTTSPIGGGEEEPATEETHAPGGGGEEEPATEETPAPGGGGGAGPAIVDNSPVRGSTGGAASLPFTGGEVTLIALTGAAALGGGLVLVAAGRKRATA